MKPDTGSPQKVLRHCGYRAPLALVPGGFGVPANPLDETGVFHEPFPVRISINNEKPRRDIHGDIIDAHDGSIEFWDGLFWLYGTCYGSSDGYSVNGNHFVSYSSPDLERWTPHGPILADRPTGLYSRPYVKKNPLSGQYVLWFNWIGGWKGKKNWKAGDGPTSPGRIGVAVADQPAGPFIIQAMEASISGQTAAHGDVPIHAQGVGDLNLFADEDGTGYITYTIKSNRFGMIVERLSSDYLRGTGECSKVLGHVVEAPAMLKRHNWYYVLFGTLCCYCPQGSGAMVFRSRNPLGPYEYRDNINRYATMPRVAEDAGGDMIVPAQLTAVSALPGGHHLWMGDRWESAPDGLKGHDFQHWETLQFDAKDDILPLARNAEETLELPLPSKI